MLVAGTNAAFDRVRDQRIEMQFAADEVEHLQRPLLGHLVGGDHFASQRVGGFAQARYQGAAHQPTGVLQPVVLVEQLHRRIGGESSWSAVNSRNAGNVCT